MFTKYTIGNKIKFIYNVSYYSYLNKIEYIFSLLIRELLKCDTSWLESIGKIIENLKKN